MVLEYLDSDEAALPHRHALVAQPGEAGHPAEFPAGGLRAVPAAAGEVRVRDHHAGLPGHARPRAGLRDLFGSKAADTEDSGNSAGIKSPAVDAMMAKMTGAKTQGGTASPPAGRWSGCSSHGHNLIPQWTAGAPHRATTPGACSRRPMPPYCAGRQPGPSTPGGPRPRPAELMAAYILKRLLLMLPTLLGVLLVTFVVTQFVPGGPVEQYRGRAPGPRRAAARAAAARLPRRGRAWTRSASSRSRRCTASTSRRTSASCRCWASTPASTWAAASSRTRTCGS